VGRLLHWMDDGEFQQLLAGARAGDDVAFAQLWRRCNPALLRFLATLADRDDAADVASTVWLEVVRGLDRFTGDEAGFRAWLFTMARSRLIDVRRARRRRPERTSHHDEADQRAGCAPDPAAVVEGELSTDDALALIGSLPPDQAEILLLRVIADLDVATVAAIVGKPPGTVRVLAHRGLRRLAAQLGADEDVTADVTR